MPHAKKKKVFDLAGKLNAMFCLEFCLNKEYLKGSKFYTAHLLKYSKFCLNIEY